MRNQNCFGPSEEKNCAPTSVVEINLPLAYLENLCKILMIIPKCRTNIPKRYCHPKLSVVIVGSLARFFVQYR
jgi:hypothetical protein